MYDVKVIGAGPAGCIAAREAARRNLNVAVFEEHKEVGARLKCSGLLSKTGLDSLGVDYKKSVMNKIYGTRIYSPALDEMSIVCRDVKAFIIDRKEFDSACADEAESLGAKILLGRRASRKDLGSKLVIGADGALSQVAAWFDFPKVNEFAFCCQADFSNAHIQDAGVVDVFLSNTLFPGFFGWCIPLNESEARVGLGVFRDIRRSYSLPARHYFNNFVKKHPVVSKILKKSKLRNELNAVIPLSPREETARSGVILVGDAAGQVKATTGGGIVFGGNCAKIAGRLAPGIVRGADTSTYEKTWRSKFGKDLMLHKRIRGVYNSLGDGQIERYFKFAKRAGAEKFLAEHGDMDSPVAMLNSAAALPLKGLFRTFGSIVPRKLL
ncbi:NAD(P)/FAD-dependent oxidoreductase [Candidatus Micrarchaeota archaeon]|nr:NAD(P)/FAD-dependent oxidoreductase [Candidatus Micrarchaeota archaeon]